MASSHHPLQEGSFDPLATLRRSGAGYSDPRGIKLRVLWLRQREPSARITTTMVSLDDRVVVMSASISLPDGGEGSGHAASRIDEATDLAETIETTELRAIGRALDNLGYVVVDQAGSSTQAQPETEEAPREPSPVPTPPEQPQESTPPAPEPQVEGPRRQPPEHVRALRSIREREQRPQQPETPETSQSNGVPGQQEAQEPAPVERTRPRPIRPTTPPPPEDDGGEPPLEDVSWTAFWEWARENYQLRSRVQLEELLGQPVGTKLPGELRRMLLQHFNEAGPGES